MKQQQITKLNNQTKITIKFLEKPVNLNYYKKNKPEPFTLCKQSLKTLVLYFCIIYSFNYFQMNSEKETFSKK